MKILVDVISLLALYVVFKSSKVDNSIPERGIYSFIIKNDTRLDNIFRFEFTSNLDINR